MESDLNPEHELALAERAALAPWIDTPPLPKWWAPSGGALVGALVFLVGESRDGHPGVIIPFIILLVFLVGAWIGWGYARVGAIPRLRGAPAEFVPVIRAYFAGYLLLLAVVIALFLSAGHQLAAIVAALGVFTGLIIFQRFSGAAAEAIRARLS